MNSQLDLFAAEEPDRIAAAVEPAAAAPDQLDVGMRLPSGLYLGTSSCSFPTWAGLVYRRRVDTTLLARAGLSAYARHPLLRAVGIDRTFYAPIPVETYAGYTRPRFKSISAFLARPVTNPRFLDAAFAVDFFVGPCLAGLGGKAGPLVFQFPPLGRGVTIAPAHFAEQLERFLETLPRGPLYAVELRDRELLGADLGRALADGGARL